MASYHTQLARILNAAGDRKKAQRGLERALAQNPDFEHAKKLMNDIKVDDAPSAGSGQGRKN